MIELLIVAGVAFFAGWKASHWLLQSAFNRVMEALGISKEQMRAAIRKSAKEEGIDLKEIFDDEEDIAEPAKLTIELKVEQVGSSLMAYRVKDDAFVAQGADAEGLFQAILNTYPTGSRVEIVEGSELVNDYVKTLKETG